MSRPYAILDVFTGRPLAGNPLAVVLDSTGLDDRRMQAIAREFNLSETVFVGPPANPMHSAAIRIFTPARELPFAGHPTVGSAVLLARQAPAARAGQNESVLVLEERIGPVRCGVTTSEHGGHAIFDVPSLSSETGQPFATEDIAAALGLMPTEIGFENHRPSVFSAGLPYHFVPVRNLSVMARVAPHGPWTGTFGDDTGVFVYCRETGTVGHHFRARMFAPGLGVAEDPATGSAVAALAGVVRRFDRPTAGSHRVVVEQGVEMGRPSLIVLEIDVADGALSASRVGGDAVIVAEGRLHV